MSIIERLPYDVARTIFDHLDRPTLFAACVASKTINELASWTLYSSIIVNREAESGYWGGDHDDKGFRDMQNPFKLFYEHPYYGTPLNM
jgi:hypothetical protein